MGAHLPQRLERRVAVRAGLLEPRRAHGTHEERRLDARPADRALAAAQTEPLLHRLDLELALAHVLEVFRGAEEHVDERTEERREKPEQRREPHDPAIADPAARVLVDPEGDPEPEDDDEEDPDVADRVPRPGLEEVVDSGESRVGGEVVIG